MADQAATIKDLILAAAQGAATGVREIRELDIPVELKEFEIEVNYSCTTEFDFQAGVETKMKFWIVKAKFSASTSYKVTTTYGLKVRFLFVGKSEGSSTSGGGSS